MNITSEKLKTLFFFILSFIIYCVITLIIFSHRVENITTFYGMPDVDTDGGLWYQWFNIYNYQNNLLPEITSLFAYPFGYDISFAPFSNLIYSTHIFVLNHILGYSWQNLILVTNLSSLITYPLSGIGAMWLCYYLTKNIKASFIGGLIFSFSFYHVYMGRGEMSINHIELIPFYILSLVYFLDKKNISSLLLSVLIYGILFKTDAYYAFFSGIFSVIIVLFYRPERILDKVKILFIYYVSLVLSLVFINFNFFLSNLYLFDKGQAAMTGRNSIPKNELVNILYFFNPSKISLLTHYVGNFSYFIYTLPIQIAVIGLLLYKKSTSYVTWMLCFLAGIVLSSYIASLYWINEIYFHYFGMFRGVGRIILPTYLFLGLMVAVTFANFEKNVSKGRKYILAYLFVFLAVILSSLNVDATWYRNTDFSKIAKLYEPIRTNDSIKAIASYPMSLNGQAVGCPQTYQFLGQIIHNKVYACGASPFSQDSISFYKSIIDISDPATITKLTKYNIDTIFIYNGLQDNAKEINKKLQQDKRLQLVGTYTQPHDKGYPSANDLSRNISVYQIKEVINKKPLPLFFVNNGKIESVTKVDSHRYLIKVKNIQNNTKLNFNSPFSNKWEIYSNKFFAITDLFMLNAHSDIPAQHQKYNEYANTWLLDKDKVKKHVDKKAYTVNPDNSINMEVMIYFKPYAFTVLGNWTCAIAIVLIVLSILVLVLKKRYNKSFIGNK